MTTTNGPEGTGPAPTETSTSNRVEHLLPDPSFLSYGTFLQEGFDLLITNPAGDVHRVADYFSFNPPPSLALANGASLTPSMMKSLFPRPFGDDILFAGPAPSDAIAKQIGQVTLVIGQVTVRHANGTTETLTKGDPIYLGDALITGAGGFVKAKMIDGTDFHLGKNGEVVLDDYQFNEAQDVGRFEATVRVGGFYYKSGKIGELPSASQQAHTQLNTPTSIIGVRGSELEGAVSPTGETVVVHKSGVLEVTDQNGENAVTLTQIGQTAVIQLGGAPNSYAQAPPEVAAQIADAVAPPAEAEEEAEEAEEDAEEEVAEEEAETEEDAEATEEEAEETEETTGEEEEAEEEEAEEEEAEEEEAEEEEAEEEEAEEEEAEEEEAEEEAAEEEAAEEEAAEEEAAEEEAAEEEAAEEEAAEEEAAEEEAAEEEAAEEEAAEEEAAEEEAAEEEAAEGEEGRRRRSRRGRSRRGNC